MNRYCCYQHSRVLSENKTGELGKLFIFPAGQGTTPKSNKSLELCHLENILLFPVSFCFNF